MTSIRVLVSVLLLRNTGEHALDNMTDSIAIRKEVDKLWDKCAPLHRDKSNKARYVKLVREFSVLYSLITELSQLECTYRRQRTISTKNKIDDRKTTISTIIDGLEKYIIWTVLSR